MYSLLPHIRELAKGHPDYVALQSHEQALSYSELQQQIEQVTEMLKAYTPNVVAIYAENSPAWVVIDLACQHLNICLLPLPTFFSEAQISHAIKAADVDILLIDAHLEDRVASSVLTQYFHPDSSCSSLTNILIRNYRNSASNTPYFPKETGKITFTSGSTGTPKGVCLSNKHLLTVASSIYSSLKFTKAKHLSLLPLSTLLENIAGIYTPLLSGGTITLLPATETGLLGSSQLNVNALLKTLTHYQPETLILIPELLQVLLASVTRGWVPPTSLKFIAVGGAKVSPSLVSQAKQVGLPAYEGYGLSECASVVSLNTPSHDMEGNVGKPLEHTNIRIEQDEIIVNNPIFLGYLNQPDSWYPTSLKTGDLGFQDKSGFLHIKGRKKNTLISSFGRNISPEWPESELLRYFSQAIVFGDQQPYCVALLMPHDTAISSKEIQSLIDLINQKLPDYARICQWIKLSKPLSAQRGLLTETGKLKRSEIYQYYQNKILQLYNKGEA